MVGPLSDDAALVDVLEESRRLGFLGPGAVEDHVRHAEALAELVLTVPERAVDLGCGGGVPGIVLARSRWSRCEWRLIEASARRCRFLQGAVDRLAITHRVSIEHGRAEDLGRQLDLRGQADLVIARSFGPPAVTAECAAPLLRQGGLLVVSDPPGPANDDRWPVAGLALVGLERQATRERPAATALVATRRCPDVYPRRTGVPQKRPLF